MQKKKQAVKVCASFKTLHIQSYPENITCYTCIYIYIYKNLQTSNKRNSSYSCMCQLIILSLNSQYYLSVTSSYVTLRLAGVIFTESSLGLLTVEQAVFSVQVILACEDILSVFLAVPQATFSEQVRLSSAAKASAFGERAVKKNTDPQQLTIMHSYVIIVTDSNSTLNLNDILHIQIHVHLCTFIQTYIDMQGHKYDKHQRQWQIQRGSRGFHGTRLGF